MVKVGRWSYVIVWPSGYIYKVWKGLTQVSLTRLLLKIGLLGRRKYSGLTGGNIGVSCGRW